MKPDVTIYLDLEVEQGLNRKLSASASGQGEWNRMDRLELELHQRVRRGYLEMAQQEPERWLVVDASASIEAVQQQIRQRLEKVIVKNKN